MPKPSIVVSTGSFAHPSMYDPLIAEVKAAGYEIKVLHLPSVGLEAGKGRDTPPATMYDDAAFIASEIEALADQGKEVVLMSHSYGGMPATESTKGLSVRERRELGKRGGLVRLAYMTVLLTTPGHAAMEVLGSVPQDGKVQFQVDEQGWLHHSDKEAIALNCFSSLPRDEAIAWGARFTLHSAVSFTNPLIHAGYKDVPVSYLVCEDDLVIPPELQRQEIAMIEKETGRKVDVTSIKLSHCPVLDEEVGQWLLRVVENV